MAKVGQVCQSRMYDFDEISAGANYPKASGGH